MYRNTLERLAARRDEADAARRAIAHRVKVENRADLTPAETQEFERLSREIMEYSTRIAELTAEQAATTPRPAPTPAAAPCPSTGPTRR
ncbi:MAG: hypothetical protein M3Q47_08815 [Actinomycetota bacterium]|nr:hypothetical protein [Actinomycetota bacterium]